MSDAVKSIGRRLFARATMGAPLALKGVVSMPNQASAYPPPMPAGMGVANAVDAEKFAFREKVFQRMRVDFRPEEEMNNARWTRRNALGGLDPDLSVLNSMSVGRRIQIQIDRDKAEIERQRSLRSRLIRMMGGNPEDFE